MKTKHSFLAVMLAGAVLVTGCANNERPSLYYNSRAYTEAMYLYLQDDQDYAKQLELMTNYITQAEAAQKKPMPGAYAHLGLLYSKTGADDKAQKYLSLEREAFPESGHYIGFLEQQRKKSAAVREGGKQ